MIKCQKWRYFTEIFLLTVKNAEDGIPDILADGNEAQTESLSMILQGKQCWNVQTIAMLF